MNKKKWIKTFQFLAAYLVAAWTFLQFIDWILNRYGISPYWVDILLWAFIGIIPSLLIYLYHQDRINKRIFKLREKIIIPLNFIVLAVALYFGFGNSDLGATTKEVEFTNEEGLLERKLITKEEFRVGVPIYGFKQLNTDSTTTWMQYGIGALLAYDLSQNKSLSPDFTDIHSTSDKIREASLFNDFYIDGSYKKDNGVYEVVATKRKASNGKITDTRTFTGPDILDLIDEVSVFVTSKAGFTEGNEIHYIDLPVKEFTSNNLEALKYFVQGKYRKAIELDSTFALAFLRQAKKSIGYNVSKLQEQDDINNAFSYKKKLPSQLQVDVLIQRNLAYDQLEEAEKLVKQQLEIDPNNGYYNNVLYSIYGETKQVQPYFNETKRIFENDPNPDNGIKFADASLVIGAEDKILKTMNKLEVINPIITTYKIEPLLFKGDIVEAEKVLEEIKLQYPDNDNRNKVYEDAINYLMNHKATTKELEDFVGTYRATRNEQTFTYWIENDRLIKHVKSQRMRAYILSGPSSSSSGHILSRTFKDSLVRNKDEKVIGIYLGQYDKYSTYRELYWKLDESITAANAAFNNGNLDEAEQLYIEAISKNPEHHYLKNILSHIQYIKDKEESQLIEEFNEVSGNYGPRLFWVENGKFYYKRDTLNKVELLPLGNNKFMDLTRLSTVMSFELDKTGKMASLSYSYDIFKDEWARATDSTNYLLKSD
ncbi:hypothetical protein [Winogradskyella sp. 3972H.M.0a.05]|uniref:tetratricopeptide repeat protein n=1 Tax=Winogradskyella sp. 3972H.M.0a.05 TaxID=2950277 RepID=UPI0033996B48